MSENRAIRKLETGRPSIDATTREAFNAGMKHILAVLLLLTLAAPAWGQDFDRGMQAYERGDYATALREWRPLANQSNASAQFNLGQMYSNGKGVVQDYAEAVKWYRKAAEQGYADAQFFLGGMYYKGEGVTQDYAEAVRWYRKAAEQGHAAAQFNLGSMYYVGLGVPRDYAKAAKWHRKAAEQGHASASFILGTMYLAGEGVPQDYVQAHMWFNLLVSRSPPGKSRGSVVETREMVAKFMTPAQIAEAQRLAREWMEKHGKKQSGHRRDDIDRKHGSSATPARR